MAASRRRSGPAVLGRNIVLQRDRDSVQGSQETIWLRSQGVESSSFRDEVSGVRKMEVRAERRAGAVVSGDAELCRAMARRDEGAGKAKQCNK